MMVVDIPLLLSKTEIIHNFSLSSAATLIMSVAALVMRLNLTRLEHFLDCNNEANFETLSTANG